MTHFALQQVKKVNPLGWRIINVLANESHNDSGLRADLGIQTSKDSRVGNTEAGAIPESIAHSLLS